MEIIIIFLTVSITLNIIFFGITLILWNRKCSECGKEKEISKSFSKLCEKCSKDCSEEKKIKTKNGKPQRI